MSNYDPTDLLGIQAEQEQSQKAKELSALSERDDYDWLMGDERGRRIVRGMLERAGVWRSSFSESMASMAFNEGRRNEGLYLLQRIQSAGMANYELMLKEGKAK